MRKNRSNDWEKLLKFEADFAKFLGSLEQFIQTEKGQNNFWNRILFLHVNGAQIWYIEAIKIPIEKNNWDVETYKNKLEKI